MISTLNYCSACGHDLVERIPDGDNRLRKVCDGCGVIHYQNPKVIVGCVPEWQGKILLCKRAIEPRKGYWTLPAGFMENGETTQQGAARETLEEACADVEVGALYTVANLPQISQIYMMFLSTLKDGSFAAGEESLEVELFAEEDIPWDELAFPTINFTLQHWFEDRQNGHFGQHITDIVRRRYRGE